MLREMVVDAMKDPTRRMRVWRLWQGAPDAETMKMIEKRIDIMEEIIDKFLPDDFPLEVTAEGFPGNVFMKWKPIQEVPEYLMAPAFYYHILPNELYIDIDCWDAEKRERVLKEVLMAFQSLGATPVVGWTGRRSYHIHVFYTVEGMEPWEFAGAQEQDLLKKFRTRLFRYVLSFLPKDARVYVDEGVMTAERHVARAFYSMNLKSGTWKVFVEPWDRFEVWEIPYSLAKRLYEEAKKEKVDVLKLAELDEDKPKRYPSSRKYSWIEKLASAGMPDGRKRFIFHVYMPYLAVVKGLSLEEAIEEIHKFLRVSEALGADGKVYDSWLRSCYKSAKSREFRPMKLETFLSKLEPSLKEYVLGVVKNEKG